MLGRVSVPGRGMVMVRVDGESLQCLEEPPQCQLEEVERSNTQDECNGIGSHAWKGFKRAGVGTNGILEYNSWSKNAHRTQHRPRRSGTALVARGGLAAREGRSPYPAPSMAGC